MSEFIAPIQGPLDNPEWTREQNREFDLGSNYKTGEQARLDAIGPDKPADVHQHEEIPGAAVARKMVENGRRPKATRKGLSASGLRIADSDGRAKTERWLNGDAA